MRNTWWIVLVLAGCNVGYQGSSGGGQPPDASTSAGGGGGGGGGGGVDAGGGGGGGGMIDAAVGGPDAGNGCIDRQTSPGSGHHNAGQDCMNGCHNHGFTIAGTLYASINGGTAVVGATVHVVDANGKTVDIVTQNNGNFYTSTSVTYPITVLATECPNVQPMTELVAGPGPTGCNRTGCHTSGNRIHLP